MSISLEHFLKSKIFSKRTLFARQASLGCVPLLRDVENILQKDIAFTQLPLIDLMPTLLVDLNARQKYLIKKALNNANRAHIHQLLKINKKSSTFLQPALTNDSLEDYLSLDLTSFQWMLDEGVQLVQKNSRCQNLCKLYHMRLFSGMHIEPHFRGREMSQCQSTKEELNIITQTLEAAYRSHCLDRLFRSVIQSNRLSNSSLNEEICLLTTKWIYTKKVLCSLKNAIQKHMQFTLTTERNISLSSSFLKMNINQKNKPWDLPRFGDHDADFISTTKDLLGSKDMLQLKDTSHRCEHYHSILLSELIYLSIEIVRDLLCQLNEQLGTSYAQENIPLQLPLKLSDNHALPIHRMLRLKLQSLLNHLYQRKLLKKKLQQAQLEPNADFFVYSVWNCIQEAFKQINGDSGFYIAEIRLASKRELHKSSSFIARKYLHLLIRHVYQGLVVVTSDIYAKLPHQWFLELQLVKLKLDTLLHYAFLLHLKDDVLNVLASTDLAFQLNLPDTFNKLTTDSIVQINVHEICAALITLIKCRLICGRLIPSPLYQALLLENSKANLIEKRSEEYEEEVQSSFNETVSFIKEPAKPITDIIENEILMRYLHLTPKLECLQDVAEFGAQIVLDLHMQSSISQI